MMTIGKMKFAWKHRRMIWKYRRLLRHRKAIMGGAAAAAALAGMVLASRAVSSRA
jgi:hypothetical protein